jgi:hypothetical protein
VLNNKKPIISGGLIALKNPSNNGDGLLIKLCLEEFPV